MDTFMQNAANSPQGLGENRYFKTSEYQIVKTLRFGIRMLALGFAAVTRLVIDVLKGIAGKN